MKTDKITTLLKKHPSLQGTLDDIKYTLDNNGSYADCKALWNTWSSSINIEEPCPSLRTFRSYFTKKQTIQQTKGYIAVLEEGVLSHVHRNIINGDPRNDKSKYYRPDLT